MAKMQKQLDEMRAMLEAQSRPKTAPIENEPLSVDIELAPVQLKIAPPPTSLYEGRMDPETHLSKYRIYMTGRGAIDATKCRLFPLTLGDLAHKWYVSLPSRSIESFVSLSTQFAAYFAAKIARPKNWHRLMRIRQEKGESDEDYIGRVDEVILTREPVGDRLALHAALGGFHRRSPMFKYLTKDFPKTYAEFRSRAGDFLARKKLLALRLGEMEIDDKEPKSA